MTLVYHSFAFDSFDCSGNSEIIAGADFEQRLLRGGRFRAKLDRLILPSSRLDRGSYSLPGFGRGAIPKGWINFGFTLQIDEPAWVNGSFLKTSDIQLYAEGSSVDYRSAPNAAWYAFQVRPADLDRCSLDVNGHSISIPKSGFLNLQLHPSLFEDLHSSFDAAFDLGRRSPSLQPLMHAEHIQQQLMRKVVLAISSATGDTDRRTINAAGNKLNLIRRCEAFLSEHLQDSFSIHDLVAASGTNERSLEYYFKEIFGINPQRWLINARLHRVRKELQTAYPYISVEDVARRWGFNHGGRFAASYRELFDEYPRQTLSNRLA
jgi:AraC-like DNA-binding protein